MRPRLDEFATHPLTLALLWASAVGLVATYVDHYWIPVDDGTLAQSAERVLAGQLPHRDFGDPYTGLNAMLGALAFRVFGVSLDSLRIPLVIGFAAWLPAVGLIALRFTSVAVATLCTALVALTSVLAYPAAMPTWFGLFALTWGLVFLLEAVDDRGRRWILAAGVAAGVSILFKVTGLYFLGAAWLTLAWRGAGRRGPERQGGGGAYAAVVGLAALAFVAALGLLVLPGARPSGVFHFFVPGAALAVGLAVRAGVAGGGGERASGASLAHLAKDTGVLMAGVALPVAIFLTPYALSGSVGAWFDGVFVSPTQRFSFASSPPGRLWTIVPGVTMIALAWWSSKLSDTRRLWLAWILVAILVVALAFDDLVEGEVTAILWYAARSWIPALTVWGAWVTVRSGDAAAFAVVATAGLWALVQFPYSAPAYLFYAAPLGVLATLAVRQAGGGGVRPLLAAFGAVWLFLGGGYASGVLLSADATLEGERAGIRISRSDADLYSRLVGEIDALLPAPTSRRAGSAAPAPRRLWVAPDAPEVYFLSGHANPTPVLYEFLHAGPSGGALDPRPGDVVVLNTRPLFSPPVDDTVLARLARQGFRTVAEVDGFQVMTSAGRSPP